MTARLQEGQFFMLPVERGQYAIGLIARVPRRGGVLLGYFFGPRRTTPPMDQWLNALHPNQAAFVCRFKDAALFRGEWKLLCTLPTFDRAQWPMPAFHRFDGSVTHVPGSTAVTDWRVEYADDNLIVPKSEAPAEAQDLKLTEDIAYDAQLLAREVGQRVVEAAPSADDANWR
ncbi:MAG: immunity 26/phosphotriesterase HocA family protein [Proteobacteria bacterium]|nr:immunity 26/phosphotriesterase HocA family protein [Pseudomonadota bacterium]